MLNQKVSTAVGSGILIILAITIFTFVAVYETSQEEVIVTSQQFSRGWKSLDRAVVTPDLKILTNLAPKETCKHGKKYFNSVSNYSIDIPSESWCLPSEIENDPHIYSDDSCLSYDSTTSEESFYAYAPCIGFEIQDHGIVEPQENQSEFDATFNDKSVDPRILKSLIKDAVVIRSEAPGAAEGWSYEYDIYFPKEHRQFLIFSSNDSFEGIFKTFTLIK